ncbi:unnamed protein product [Blepharisma stoltei]|uniref:Ubiquitin-like domain-containing protein n=1 Tax=Blepharisma stoltei TaxID=1481888 RepID=A0AAU9JDX9_9CILI|nr:unnamed protein product [Blepharisma stoltei]
MADRILISNTQFVRVKSLRNETFFITCKPKDSVSMVKYCVYLMCGLPVEDMKLYIRNRLLEDVSSLYDQQVANDTVLFLVSKKPDGSWENVSQFMPGNDQSPLSRTFENLSPGLKSPE